MYSVLGLLRRENIFANLEVENKKTLLNTLLSSFKDEISAKEFRAISQSVYQREQVISTGIGNGLAIPHGVSSDITGQYAALAVLKTPVDFDAFDAKPVSVAFLFAGPESKKHSHLNLMSEISRLMNDKNFYQMLMQQQTKEELYDFLKNYS